jgi:putative heme-binding domain-containing protein
MADAAMAAWQTWFAGKFPDLPEPMLPKEAVGNKWSYSQLLEFLSNDKGAAGDPNRGAAIFEKAQCVKCHRYGNRGEGVGPDLSNVSKRFQRKEILESVIFPSQVISDQFAAKRVRTVDGKAYEGLVGPAGDGIVIMQSNAEKVTIPNSEVEEVVSSRTSTMPEGLFDLLTLAEIADLFAYLGEPPPQ